MGGVLFSLLSFVLLSSEPSLPVETPFGPEYMRSSSFKKEQFKDDLRQLLETIRLTPRPEEKPYGFIKKHIPITPTGIVRQPTLIIPCVDDCPWRKPTVIPTIIHPTAVPPTTVPQPTTQPTGGPEPTLTPEPTIIFIPEPTVYDPPPCDWDWKKHNLSPYIQRPMEGGEEMTQIVDPCLHEESEF